MFIVSEKKGPNGLLLVVTDKDILDKIFEEGKRILDIKSDFYKGEEHDKDYVKQKIADARDLHFTGKESIAILIEMNIINSDKILWVDKVPHAQVVIGD